MKLISFISLFLFTLRLFSQDSMIVDARIIVTYPAAVKSTNVPEKALEPFRLTAEQKLNNKPDTSNRSNASAKVIEVKESQFLNGTDFFGEFSFRLNEYIGFNLVEIFDDLLSYPVLKKANPELASFRKLAADENTNWIISITSAELRYTNAVYSAEASVCVYNSLTDTIVFKNSYTLQSINHGSMYACNSGSPDCIINDFVYQCGDAILKAMLEKKEYWVKN